MHELSIAASLVESVLEFIDQHGGRKVVGVRMAIGELTCVEADQLAFCYESVTTETALEGSKIQIETIPARVLCHYCDYEGAAKYLDDTLASTPVATLQCPRCGKTTEAVAGHECAIKSIQYVA
jgi:hydrogenase nickel incorporation protein HypA/HybF